MNAEKQHGGGREAVGAYLRFMGLGITMVGIILAFTFLGWWVDGLLAWRIPVCTLIGALLGITGAMLHLFKETRPRR